MTASDLLTPLLTADPNGNIATISYDQTGALNVLSTSPDATLQQVVATPEPGGTAFAFVLVASTIARYFGLRSRRRRIGKR